MTELTPDEQKIFDKRVEEYYIKEREYRIKECSGNNYMRNRQFEYSMADEIHSMTVEIIDLENKTVIESIDFDNEKEMQDFITRSIEQFFMDGVETKRGIRSRKEVTKEKVHFSGGPYLLFQQSRDIIQIGSIKSEIISERMKQERYSAWKDACQWCDDHGIKVRHNRDGSVSYNRRSTITERIKDAGLVKEFNQAFPQFMITVKSDNKEE